MDTATTRSLAPAAGHPYRLDHPRLFPDIVNDMFVRRGDVSDLLSFLPRRRRGLPAMVLGAGLMVAAAAAAAALLRA